MEKSDFTRNRIRGLQTTEKMFIDPEIEDKVVGWAFPLSQYAQEQWFIKHYADENKRFIIETIDEHRAIGIATLINLDRKNRSVEHGIKIASKNDRGKGYGVMERMQ